MPCGGLILHFFFLFGHFSLLCLNFVFAHLLACKIQLLILQWDDLHLVVPCRPSSFEQVALLRHAIDDTLGARSQELRVKQALLLAHTASLDLSKFAHAP